MGLMNKIKSVDNEPEYISKEDIKEIIEEIPDGFTKMVNITIDIPDDVFIFLALEAHKKDVTLNNYINTILRKYVESQGGL